MARPSTSESSNDGPMFRLANLAWLISCSCTTQPHTYKCRGWRLLYVCIISTEWSRGETTHLHRVWSLQHFNSPLWRTHIPLYVCVCVRPREKHIHPSCSKSAFHCPRSHARVKTGKSRYYSHSKRMIQYTHNYISKIVFYIILFGVQSFWQLFTRW